MRGWALAAGAAAALMGLIGLGIMAVREHNLGYACGAAAWLVCFLFYVRDGTRDARAEDAKRKAEASADGAPRSSAARPVPAPIQRADPVVPMLPAPGVPREPKPRPDHPDPQIPGLVAHDPDCCRPRRRRL